MLIDIRKIKTEKELEAMIKAAAEDNADIQFPSHMLTKDGKIVGGWSMGTVPLTMVWHDSNKVTVRDSIMLNKTIDALMNDRGHAHYLMACDSTSPYNSYMEKFGHNLIWNTNLYYKEIT